jgi:hypothetical protein
MEEGAVEGDMTEFIVEEESMCYGSFDDSGECLQYFQVCKLSEYFFYNCTTK